MVKRRALSLLSRRVCPDRPAAAAATRRTNASTRWDSLWRALPFKKKFKKKKIKKKKRGGPVTPPKAHWGSTIIISAFDTQKNKKKKKKKPSFFVFWFLVWHQQLSYMVAVERASMAVVCLESWFKRKLSKSTSALNPAYLYALIYLGDGCFKVSFLVLFGDDSTAEIFAILHRVNSNLQRKRQSSWLFPFLFKYHRYISYQGYIYIYVKQFNNTITEIKSRHASQKIQKKGQYTKIIIKQKQKTEKKILSRVSHHH